jgi:uncharacterized membrane protein YphA (DoxX/SURF4 family)
METLTANYVRETSSKEITQTEKVISILKWTYGLVPIVAGADKFAHLLVNWDQYLAPVVTEIIPVTPHTFMTVVGLIEIVAGIMVLIRPRIGSVVVSFWLLGIAINLLMTGQYFDIAVRDTAMAIGAFSLFLLLKDKHESSDSISVSHRS